MKIAWFICLMLAGFLLGWWLNAPERDGYWHPQNEPDTIELSGNASPEWQAQVEGKSTREVVTAIFGESLEASYEEKLGLFQSLMAKDRSTARELHARMLLMSMNQEELHRAIEQARFDQADRHTMDLLYARLVDLDRDAAWAYFLQQSDPDEVSILSYYIFKRWVLEDQAGALAAWSQLDDHTKQARLNTMVKSLAEVDLNAALQLQLTYGQMTSRDANSYRDLIRQWAQQDLATARQALALVPRGAHQAAYSAYFDELIQADRELAMTEAQALPGFTDKNRALSQVYRHWLAEDVDGALAALATEKTPEDYFSAWQLANDEPEKLMSWALENMKGSEQDSMVSTAMRAMIRREGGLELALGYLNALPYGEAYERSLSSLASEWTEDDPEAAIAWARQLGDAADQSRALSSIMSRYARDDPDAAKQFFLTLDETQRQAVEDNLVRRLTDRDPLGTLAWIDSLPSEANPSSLRKEAYQAWSRVDGTGLFDHLGQQGFRQLESAQRGDLMRRWAEYSPNEASAWLQSMPTDDYDENEVLHWYRQVSDQWLDSNTYEASQWIATLPQGKPREIAVTNLINEIRRNDPASAFEWVADVGEDQQLNTASSVLRDWKDKEAAYQALVSSELSTENIDQLMKQHFGDRP